MLWRAARTLLSRQESSCIDIVQLSKAQVLCLLAATVFVRSAFEWVLSVPGGTPLGPHLDSVGTTQGLAEFGTSIQYIWLADFATSSRILSHVHAWLYQHLRSLQSTTCAELAHGSMPGTWIKLENVRVWLPLFFWQNTDFVMSA